LVEGWWAMINYRNLVFQFLRQPHKVEKVAQLEAFKIVGWSQYVNGMRSFGFGDMMDDAVVNGEKLSTAGLKCLQLPSPRNDQMIPPLCLYPLVVSTCRICRRLRMIEVHHILPKWSWLKIESTKFPWLRTSFSPSVAIFRHTRILFWWSTLVLVLEAL